MDIQISMQDGQRNDFIQDYLFLSLLRALRKTITTYCTTTLQLVSLFVCLFVCYVSLFSKWNLCLKLEIMVSLYQRDVGETCRNSVSRTILVGLYIFTCNCRLRE